MVEVIALETDFQEHLITAVLCLAWESFWVI